MSHHLVSLSHEGSEWTLCVATADTPLLDGIADTESTAHNVVKGHVTDHEMGAAI